jgi:hypothetical protein
MAQTVHGLAFGLKTHALGSFGSAANALGAYAGLGAAAVGMFATTAAQLRAAKKRGEIPSEDPKYIRLAEEYEGRVRPAGPAPSERPYAPGAAPEEGAATEAEGAPEETPAEEGAAPGETTESTAGEAEKESPEIEALKRLGPEIEALKRLNKASQKLSQLIVEIREELTPEELAAKRKEFRTLQSEVRTMVEELGLEDTEEGRREYSRWNDSLGRQYRVSASKLRAKESLSDSEKTELEKYEEYLRKHMPEVKNAEFALLELIKKKRAEGGAAPAAEE